MTVTPIFTNGHSQTVRLSKNFQEAVILRRPPKNLGCVFSLLIHLPDDFMIGGRQDTPPEEREFYQ